MSDPADSNPFPTSGLFPSGARPRSLPENLSPSELARYSRQLILPGFGPWEQARLKEARVLCVGAGGLGSPVALYLAGAGVGTLCIIDADKVKTHNLHRQVIHDTDSVGRSKVESARARLAALNPHCQVRAMEAHLEGPGAREIIREYDLVVDGSDNFPTRFLVNDACVLEGVPLVSGSIFQFQGQVSLYHPASGGPCLRCLFPEIPPPGSVPNCAEAGVLGALCGVIGSVQAMEAIKWLSGRRGECLLGRLVSVDLLGMRFREMKLKRDPRCPVCGGNPSIRKIEPNNYGFACQPQELQDSGDSSPRSMLFQRKKKSIPAAAGKCEDTPLEVDVRAAAIWCDQSTNGDSPWFLDVREDFERAICSIPGSAHIPMGEVGQRLDTLPRDRILVVYCHHGARSARVTHLLRSKGFRHATNLSGGIDRWAREIEPGMARY